MVNDDIGGIGIGILRLTVIEEEAGTVGSYRSILPHISNCWTYKSATQASYCSYYL